MKRTLLAFGLVLVSILIFSWVAFGQDLSANHPELRWRTFETEHFVIHYHQGAERTANVIARIAEEIHPVITNIYNYEPDTKFHFMVRDTDDYANGAAYYYNNKMLIWCTALDYDLRGTTNWLRNVITHEYTHIIQLGAARKLPRNIPAIYVQAFGFEEEQRPDVLYGYPNILTSYPLAMTTMPMWFAEGTAQYNSPDLPYDFWDSHRDMQLRVRALNNNLLPLNEMEVFGKNSMGSEGVYNHGFGLVKYISETYGVDKLRELTDAMSDIHRFSFNSAIHSVFGITGDELYAEWTEFLTSQYEERTEIIRANIVTGDEFEYSGYATFYPRWNSAGDTLYYTSNTGNDYYSDRSIYRRPVNGGEPEQVVRFGMSPFDLTEDGRYMVYSSIVRQSNESYYADLYLYDLVEDEKIRLTRSARMMEPSFSPDERSIVGVINHDGTKDIVRLDLPPREEWPEIEITPTDSLVHLTDFRDGTQCWRPHYSPDGEWIVYARGRDIGRDVILVRPDGSEETVLVGGLGDQRDPDWSADGEWIYYSSDETGIFNLYRYHVETGTREAITNVIGGAFMPDVHANGEVAYIEYTERGFELRILRETEAVDETVMEYNPDYLTELPEITYNDTNIDTAEAVLYNTPFEQLFFVPRITWDYGGFKPGIYVFSSDFLEKLQMFAGVARNARSETDLFFLLDFHALRPTVFLEGFFITRVDDQRFDDIERIVGERQDDDGFWVPVYDTYGVSYDFSLMEADGGLRFRLSTPLELELRGVYSRYQAALEYDDGGNFQYTYFKGRQLQARLDFDLTERRLHGNIHPRSGIVGQLTVARESNDFIEGFEINAEKYTLQEVFKRWDYWRFEADVTTWFNPVGDLTIQPRLRLGYLDKQVDPFMHLYAGGMHGMRGYTYYSLGGTRKVIASMALRHPIWTPDRPRFAWLHMDGLYAGVFGDVGDAWRERNFEWDELRSDVGVELRAKFYSWYGFPTAVTFAAARALNDHSVTERGETTFYDQEWRYYLTVLFNFETIFPSNTMARR